MNEDELHTALNAAKGEALFASLMLNAVIKILVQGHLLTQEQVLDAADVVQLILERHRETLPSEVGANDHARSRLEALLKHYSTRPPNQPI